MPTTHSIQKCQSPLKPLTSPFPSFSAARPCLWKPRHSPNTNWIQCPHIHLTCNIEWNPHTVRLSAAQSAEAESACDAMEPGLAQISSGYRFREMADAINQQCFIKEMTHVDVPAACTFVSSNQHSKVTGENLSEKWNIRLSQARKTLQVTTQHGVRSAILPLSRRYRTDRMYQQRKLRNQKFYTDTLFGKCKSLTNNTCVQIFANESYFVKAYLQRQCGSRRQHVSKMAWCISSSR